MLTLNRTTDGSGREQPSVACGAWFTAESRPLVLTDRGGLLEGVCPKCKAEPSLEARMRALDGGRGVKGLGA